MPIEPMNQHPFLLQSKPVWIINDMATPSLVGNTQLLPKEAVPVTPSLAVTRVPVALHPRQHLVLGVFFT